VREGRRLIWAALRISDLPDVEASIVSAVLEECTVKIAGVFFASSWAERESPEVCVSTTRTAWPAMDREAVQSHGPRFPALPFRGPPGRIVGGKGCCRHESARRRKNPRASG
jgi:hypothetical protein